jgi:ATP-binding cassette subfamily C protein
VGERGTQLSGGERQRLALARALLRRPLLLVLDEATSALDAANQDRIGHALARLRGRVTILLIAHHSALVEQADQVVVLQAGRVSEVRRRRSGGVLDEQVAVLPHNGLALATNE